MAGDWIKMRRSLLGDPRVVRIASALQADRFRTIGGLFSAWCLFDEQTEDGKLDGYTSDAFDEIVGMPGICAAMASVGWIEIREDSLVAVEFCKHNGQSAKKRIQDTARKASARKADKSGTESGTREEKRREESITHTHTGGGIAKEKVDPKLLPHWEKWCSWLETITGRKVDPIRAETMLMDMERRGIEKSIRDIDFSILKDAKALLDSENDFQKQMASPRQNGPPKKPKKTVHEMMEEIYGPRDQWDKEDEQK